MNICYPVETEQGTLNSLHGQFRLAPRFVVYNTETSETQTIENKLEKGNYSIDVPLKSLVELSVNAVIVGGISKSDLQKINNQGIKVFQAVKLNVKECISEFSSGKLAELTQENVHRGHPQ